MKIYFIQIIEKIKNIPFIRKTVGGLVTTVGVVEIADSFIAAANSSLPFTARLTAGAKGSCCSVALFTAYSSQFTRTPAITAGFRFCCATSTYGYYLLGGDTKLVLGVMSLISNRTDANPMMPKLPKP
jgi:hypothetical protein